MGKPNRASGYDRDKANIIRRTCLYVATVLGSLMEDSIVVAGGFVPYLLVPQDSLPAGAATHIGTDDLDLALSLALLEEERYHEVAERLRGAGFEPDRNDHGNRTGQRWKIEIHGVKVRIDFLIPPGRASDRGGRIINLEGDFAAFVTPGLELAWRDRLRITLTGSTILGERATRGVWVCGPGAFVLLKALAFRDRGEPKDAYDLYYVLRNYRSGAADVAAAFRAIMDHSLCARALAILREDFSDLDATGPMRVAAFLEAGAEEALQADVVAFVTAFLAACQES